MGKMVLKYIPVVVLVIMSVLFFAFSDRLDLDKFIALTPSNILLSAIFFFALYIVKGLTAIFPISLMRIASGYSLPMYLALLINIIGTAAAFSISYLIGRYVASSWVDRIANKSTTIQNFFEKQKHHDFLLCFLLRLVPCLPGYNASYYLGARKVPFIDYIVGSVTGNSLQIVISVMMGVSLYSKNLGMLISTSLVMIVLIMISVIFFNKKSQSRTSDTKLNVAKRK